MCVYHWDQYCYNAIKSSHFLPGAQVCEYDIRTGFTYLSGGQFRENISSVDACTDYCSARAQCLAYNYYHTESPSCQVIVNSDDLDWTVKDGDAESGLKLSCTG